MVLPNCSIDIIIPYYRAADTLPRTLASVAMQSMAGQIAVTVVDDCSGDGALESVVEKFRGIGMDIRAIALEENKGPGHARQVGLDATDGDYVFFMDADDTLEGSLGIEKLAMTIERYDMDIVSGAFIEETENGVMVAHPVNMTWVFGKLYRRSFLERFDVRFNDTRANEDVGFNCVCAALTDRVKHVPQTVYCWHWAANTITRANHGEYTYGHGHTGFVENMIWAYDEMERRGLGREILRNHVVTMLCRLYFMHESVREHAPDEAAASWGAICAFYIRCFKPMEASISAKLLHAAYVEENENTKIDYMPRATFREYLANLREDTEEVMNDGDGETGI